MGVFVYEEGERKYKPIADSFFETLESEHTESTKVILHHKPLDGAEAYKICRLCGNVKGNCRHSESDKRVLYLLDTTQKLDNDIEDEFPYEEPEKTCINCDACRTLSETVRPLSSEVDAASWKESLYQFAFKITCRSRSMPVGRTKRGVSAVS
ncbi:MAG: hypothetical protein BWK80_20610 [Desulfobacteraceae bacterium IS3]|nr:MAG: hypothetical protein BWK80_20610 [Desulfobacteraceae bacterium IS3]